MKREKSEYTLSSTVPLMSLTCIFYLLYFVLSMLLWKEKYFQMIKCDNEWWVVIILFIEIHHSDETLSRTEDKQMVEDKSVLCDTETGTDAWDHDDIFPAYCRQIHKEVWSWNQHNSNFASLTLKPDEPFLIL